MVHQSREVIGRAREDRHLQRVDGKVTAQRGRDLPADDIAAEHIDDKGHIDPARMGLHVGQVRNPETVRRMRDEVSVDEVTRPGKRLIAKGRALELSATTGALESEFAHQALDCAPGNSDALAVQLVPNLVCPVDREVLCMDTDNLGLEHLVTDASLTDWTGFCRVIRCGSKLQGSTDRLDSPSMSVDIDKRYDLLG